MSMLPMYRTCNKCKKEYTYNPSVGNFGFTCPHCTQLNVFTAKDVISSMKQEKERGKVPNKRIL